MITWNILSQLAQSPFEESETILKTMDHDEHKETLESRIKRLENTVERVVHDVMPKLDRFLENISSERPHKKHSMESHSGAWELASAPESSYCQFIHAAEQGDSMSLLQILAHNEESILHRNEHGDSALHLAAANGHLPATIVLLGAGGGPSLQGRRLRTPLHCAAAGGHLRVAKRLLDAGAPFDARDADGATALSLAAEAGHVDLVALLLDKGAQPNPKRRSPMVLAAMRGHRPIVKLLLRKGVSPDTTDMDGETAVVLAAKERQWEAVHLLLQHSASPVRYKNPEESLLVLAAKYPNLVILREILQRGAGNDAGQVKLALDSAANSAVVWAFVEASARGFNEDTRKHALLQAASNGRTKILVALLDCGTDVNCKYERGMTALHKAAANGHVECVLEILNHGADFHLQDDDGNTPLHAACEAGQEVTARCLLQRGVRISIKNKNEKTPYQVASSDEVRILFKN